MTTNVSNRTTQWRTKNIFKRPFKSLITRKQELTKVLTDAMVHVNQQTRNKKDQTI